MRTGNLIFNSDFLQNSFQLAGQTLTGWYQSAKNIFSDESPFFLQAEKEQGYQQFQQWCSDLKNTLRVIQKDIAKGAVNSILFQQENILSPFYYQEQLTQFEKNAFAFSNSVREAKARLKEQLKTEPEVAETYFYNDLINHVITHAGKENAETILRSLLTYYKDFIKEALYQSVENLIENFIETVNVYYQQEENALEPLPDTLMRQVLNEINVVFMHARSNENPGAEQQRESFATRFSNSLQETTLALKNSVQTITKPKNMAAIGTVAALGYLYSLSKEEVMNTRFGISIESNWPGSFYQTTNFINTVTVVYGINIVAGNQALATPTSIVMGFSSLVQSIFAEPQPTIKNNLFNLSDEQSNNDTLLLTKRQGSASQVPIVSESLYIETVVSYDIFHSSSSIVIVDELAYVADGGLGLRIINVSNPAVPVEVGIYNTPGYSYDVAVLGIFAYVADGNSGLQIINVETPSAPFLVGSYNTPGTAFGITVSNNLAYVADSNAGLQIIDVGTPSAPVLIGSYDTPGVAFDVTVSNNLAYVADDLGGLRIIDVGTPSTPILIGYYYTPGNARGITVSNNLAYVADGNAGLQIIDVGTPSNPILIGSYYTPDLAYGVTVYNNLAYVADNNSGLQVIDISTPSTPTRIGNFTTSDSARGVVVSGKLVYVAIQTSGLQIISVDFVPTLFVNTLTITQGQLHVFNNTNLLATDQDNDDNTLTYVIESLQRGLFRIGTNATVVTEFTQQQVLNGDIEFIHDGGSQLPPYYTVSVSDGIARTQPEVAAIDFSLAPVTTGVGTSNTATDTSVTVSTSTTGVTTLAAPTSSTTSEWATTNNVLVPTTTSDMGSSEEVIPQSNSDADTLVWLLIAGLGTSGLLLCGLLGTVSYLCYQRRKTGHTIELDVDLEARENSLSPERTAKTHTTIGKKYALINEINRSENETLYQQTGLRFVIPEGQNKVKTIIDKGNFGKLRVAQNILSGRYLGVKKIKGKEKIAVSEKEAALQFQVSREPHIMPLLDSVKTIGSDEQPVLYQFMPLAGFGNGEALQKILRENTTVDASWLILQIAQQLLQGFDRLRAHCIAHLDFKLSNMVLNNQGEVLIIDFGCAQQYSATSDLLQQSFGDTRYYAPERLAFHRSRLPKNKAPGMPRAQDFPGCAADMWALGVSLLELSLGKYPFADCTTAEKFAYWNAEYFEIELESVLDQIAKTGDPSATRQALVTLLRGLLRTDPNQRSTAKEALEHPIFENENMASHPNQVIEVLTLLIQQNQEQAQNLFEEQRKKAPIVKTEDTNYDRAIVEHYETGNENISQADAEAAFFDRYAQALQNINIISYEAMPSTERKNKNEKSSNEEIDSDEDDDTSAAMRLS